MEKIADRIDSLRIEYDNIRRACPEFAKFTHEEFVWARLGQRVESDTHERA